MNRRELFKRAGLVAGTIAVGGAIPVLAEKTNSFPVGQGPAVFKKSDPSGQGYSASARIDLSDIYTDQAESEEIAKNMRRVREELMQNIFITSN